MRKNEFVNYYKENNSQTMVNQTSAQVFRMFDNDQDGKVDFVEYFIASQELSQDGAKQKLQLVFKMFDKDGQGKITQKEMEEVLRAAVDENSAKELAADSFRCFDRDITGTLTQEEFVNGCLNDKQFMKIFAPNE